MLRQRSVYGSAKSCFIPTKGTVCNKIPFPRADPADLSSLRNRRILPHNLLHNLRRIRRPRNRHYSKNRYFEIA